MKKKNLPGKLLVQSNEDIGTDDLLTDNGIKVLEQYAAWWLTRNVRALELERRHPALVNHFYAVRSDPKVATEFASTASGAIADLVPLTG